LKARTKPVLDEATMSERDLFIAAMKISEPAERSAWLDRECGGDAAVRQRLAVLLQAFDKAGSLLENPVVSIGPTNDEPISERPGTVIGPYKLLEQVSEGGFGMVFMAEQQEPIRRKVALKVLKPGMDSKQVIARFEVERQALALMDHPNIAKVLDAGQSAHGRPYFVMDLVKGVPITEYCDQGQLTPRERLELFVHVCQAVQHAHQKGIIHRDLKPSNVLVTLHDGTPLVKIIDFGIAKTLGQQLTDKTLFTGFAQMIGTPLYMSPEQAALSNVDVDTRSDIYSLGVLLYELLTGTTPFDKDRLREASFDEIRHIIREEEPPKPSTRVSTLGQAATTVSTQRRSDPKRLSQLFRGELDCIVMKALEKDRNRRYETASALAADVQHYLHDEPVAAGPPSTWYRVRKFARRNRLVLAVAAGFLVMVALAAGSVGWALRDRSLRHEQAVLEAAKTRGDIDRLRRQGQWAAAVALAQRAEALLAGASAELHHEFSELCCDLTMAARLEEIRLSKSEVKNDFYDVAAAEPEYLQAFQAYGIDLERLEPEEAAQRIRARAFPEELAAALDDWASLRGAKDKPGARRLRTIARVADPDPFRNQVRDALASGRRKALEELAASDKVTELPTATILLLAYALDYVRAEDGAISLLRQARSQRPDDFWINENLAHLLLQAHPPQVEDAARFFSVAASLRPQSPGAVLNVGYALNLQRKSTEAIASFRRAIELQPEYAEARYNLGSALFAQAKYAAAEDELRRTVQLKPGHVPAHFYFGRVFHEQGRHGEAAKAYARVIELQPNHMLAHYNRGIDLCQQGQLADGTKAFRRAIQLAPDHPEAHVNLGHALALQWQLGEAVTELRRAIQLKPDLPEAHADLGFALARQGAFAEAVREYRRALQLKPESAEVHSNLGNALDALDKLGEATLEYRRAVALKPGLATAHSNLGTALRKQEKLLEAADEYLKALQIKPDYTKARRNLSTIYLRLGQWDRSSAELQQLLCFDPTNCWGWYWSATLRLHANDKDSYRRACQEMLVRFATSQDATIAQDTVRICALAPDSLGNTEAILRLADRAVRGAEKNADRGHLLTRAMVEYRVGHFASAADWLKRVSPKVEGQGVDVLAFALQALTYNKQGQPQEAQAALTQAQGLLANKMPDPVRGERFGNDCDDWLHGQIVCREAEKVLSAQNRRARAVKPPVATPGR
jgi:serine/threonine protein kinase/Tfp pilus assembly protein PilF